jgi:hypothetical protein
VHPPSPREEAWSLHETFMELLRRLNQAAEEGVEIHGLEFVELERVMARFWSMRSGEFSVDRAVELLVENGLVGMQLNPEFSWMRNRTVGTRYYITPLGKAYLLREIEETGRIR